jgi:nicotinate-nucleotide adenylyltransferase
LPRSLADRRRRRVGLLGGSFNPAHGGHRHISLLALHLLDLDEIWWLVSPQNPLKDKAGMGPFAERLALAAKVAHHPRIKVTDLEVRLGTRYTADTLRALHQRFPRTRFVWLMGADNLRQLRHWRHWQGVFEGVPIAVFARPSYSQKALAELAAQRYAHNRAGLRRARRLAEQAPPAWAFFPVRLDARSATAIRARRAAKRRVSGKPDGQRGR